MATGITPGRQAAAARLLEQLYGRHRKRLLGVAAANSAGPDDAEEALQDAIVLFLRHFDPSEETPPMAWLTLTLKRRCWAIYRHRRRSADVMRRLAGAAAPPPQTPEEAAEAAELLEASRTVLANLKPAERRALGLLALGYAYREIVQITGWSYTKVNRLIREGRERARRAR